MTIDPRAQTILTFWFGDLDERGLSDAAHTAQWWKKDASFDRALVEQFGELHREIVKNQHQSWLETPQGSLAYVIVLDQFSRNMFRDTAQMYAADERAQRVVRDLLSRGDDKKLSIQERVFLLMPLMHSESLEDQERCVKEFEALWLEAPEAAKGPLKMNVDYAIQHRDIVKRFDRFPHRNALVGRPSTPEEEEFLKQPGSSF